MIVDKLLLEHRPWIEQELVRHLQHLIRLDTRSDKAQEASAARYLVEQLAEAGICHEMVEPITGKGSVVAFMGGEGSDRLESSLLLLAHTDTAAWDEEEWVYPPLSGVLQDGYIWGRGAVDCKGLAVVWLVLFLLMAKCRLQLPKPLIFAAVADEENGGQYGAGWLLKHTKLLDSVGAVMGEGGGYPVTFGGRRYLTCQTGEMGVIEPPLANIGQGISHTHENSLSVSEFCRRVFAGQKRGYRWLGDCSALRLQALSRLQRNSSVQVDLTALLQPKQIMETNLQTSLFRLITDQAKQDLEIADVVPYITPGFSDNRYFRARGIPVYGFFPFRDEKAIVAVHRSNERIKLNDLHEAFNILFKVVSRFCRTQ